MDYRLSPSTNSNIRSQESYIIHRGDEVFLRLWGGPTEFELVTATAGEHKGHLVACRNQARLLEAAKATLRSGGLQVCENVDRYDRPFVSAFEFKLNPETRDRSEATELLNAFATAFFANYDLLAANAGPLSASENLYSSIAVDASGEDAYLGDGLYVTREDCIVDRGR